MDAALYEEHARLQERHWWFVGRRRIVATVLDRHLPRCDDRHILDVGCGTGSMLSMLDEYGTVRGIEPEPAAVEWCRTRRPDLDVQIGSVPEAVPDSACLDLVTAFDVIEHIEDDRGAVEAFARALVPGGHVLVTVPALPWLWSDHDVRNHHFRRYRSRPLTELFTAAGLDIVHRSYFNTALFPAAAAKRLLDGRLGRSSASDLLMPSRRLNDALGAVFASERRLVARHRLPIGVSLILVAQRPT